MSQGPLTLVAGASGYVGGRLVAELERRGRRVRCLARRPEHVRPRVRGDDRGGPPATCWTRPRCLRRSRAWTPPTTSCTRWARAATSSWKTGRLPRTSRRPPRAAGVRRIVYLGGLGREPGLSRHLRSRQEVGRILRESGVPTLELRASIVIGSGSLSFEMVRALVERLPVMITPRWVSQPTQPIAIEDLVEYLRDGARCSRATSRRRGRDRRRRTASRTRTSCASTRRQRGLRRRAAGAGPGADAAALQPVAGPGDAALCAGRARADREHPNATVVGDDSARDACSPRCGRAACARRSHARARQRGPRVRRDALVRRPLVGGRHARVGRRQLRLAPRRLALRARRTCARPGVRARSRRIGGATGWYYGDWLWRLRGFLDLLAGGVGVRRGRRDPEQLRPGDVLDFWRVEAVEYRSALLRLRAEMKLPGRAWLQFELAPEAGGTRLRQTAIFEPRRARRPRSTGTPSTPSTSWSSRACCAGSPARPPSERGWQSRR